MTIRRRITLAFLTILALFAVNQAFQWWSANLRATSMATLDRALKRQLLMGSLRETFDDLAKQVSLLTQLETTADAPEARRLFNEELERAAATIRQLNDLSDVVERPAVVELQHTYETVAALWRKFYEYLGVDHEFSLAYELRAEPPARTIMGTMLPQLQRQQAARVNQAETQFASVTRLTRRVTLVMFGLSMILAVVVAYRVGRYLTTALGELNQGATMIGRNLDYRIAPRGRDEIGAVARSFNEMANNVATARQLLTTANSELESRNTELERQRQVADSLLLNVLPQHVAVELATHGKVQPRYFEDVTIIFTDFVGFTRSTEQMAADELVRVLNGYFTAFDEILARYDLEKLKTIGDSYFCVGGMPVRTPSHPVDAVLAAFEMVQAVKERARHDEAGWSVRIGIHTGPVIAGVIGIKKFAFDIWGDTVNLASRCETAGAPNRINVSWAVQRRVKDFFAVESRGKITTKEQIDLEMYFVDGLLPSLEDQSGAAIPPKFAERYRTYFSKDPPAFPPALAGPAAITSSRTGSPTSGQYSDPASWDRAPVRGS